MNYNREFTLGNLKCMKHLILLVSSRSIKTSNSDYKNIELNHKSTDLLTV